MVLNLSIKVSIIVGSIERLQEGSPGSACDLTVITIASDVVGCIRLSAQSFLVRFGLPMELPIL